MIAGVRVIYYTVSILYWFYLQESKYPLIDDIVEYCSFADTEEPVSVSVFNSSSNYLT
jgi:hypothetical protein